MKTKRPFDLDVLRQRLAVHGIHPAREPHEFQHHARLYGLTVERLGHNRFGYCLNMLRKIAFQHAGHDHAIAAIRDPVTHERQGYAVYAHDRRVADYIVASASWFAMFAA